MYDHPELAVHAFSFREPALGTHQGIVECACESQDQKRDKIKVRTLSTCKEASLAKLFSEAIFAKDLRSKSLAKQYLLYWSIALLRICYVEL